LGSVYNNTAREAVLSSLSGYNASIIAYGQTGTGKTYTMEGEPTPRLRGIIPRATEEIFGYIENAVSERKKFLVRASYLQIYNEVISDLLKPERTNLNIREDKRRGVFVEGLSEWVVRSPKEVYGLMQRGAVTRATASTKMNEISSRSHAVFIIIAEQLEYIEDTEPEGQGKSQAFKVGKLNLVDLAGSERVRLTGATGRRLEESKKINQSLSALGNVIAALTDSKGRQHIPYRDSKLTRILEDSLGGNCKTTMMAMISPALESFPESLSTLKFANRAKNIKNEARVNEDLDQRGLLRKYELEIRKLRSELESKSKEIVDKRKVLHLEELRRRAEADKVAALSQLEERSKEFMREKQEKRKLEHKLHSMSSQLLIGGNQGQVAEEAPGALNVESTPAFRTALRAEHDRIHKEYLKKMEDLERERTVLEEDKVQVDRYKQLLTKQRDIMIALTSRLNERDDTIMRLQEELDAYDRHQRMMEDVLDQKTAAFIHLQRVAMEQAINPEMKARLAACQQEALTSEGGHPSGNSEAGEEVDATVFSAAEVRGGGRGGRGATSSSYGALLDQAGAVLEGKGVKKAVLEHLQAQLEQMVQVEVEERIEGFRREAQLLHGGEGAEAAQLRERCRNLEAQIREVESASRRRGSSDGDSAELERLQASHVQFKQDVTARLGQKNAAIKDLEDEVARLRARLAGSGTGSTRAQAHRMDVEEGRSALEQDLAAARKSNEEQAHKIGVLKHYCSMNAKERNALRTIMEVKIKGLVDVIASAAGDAAPGATALHDRLAALQKIVNARFPSPHPENATTDLLKHCGSKCRDSSYVCRGVPVSMQCAQRTRTRARRRRHRGPTLPAHHLRDSARRWLHS